MSQLFPSIMTCATRVILPELTLVEVVIKEKGQLNASIVMRKG